MKTRYRKPIDPHNDQANFRINKIMIAYIRQPINIDSSLLPHELLLIISYLRKFINLSYKQKTFTEEAPTKRTYFNGISGAIHWMEADEKKPRDV